MKRKKLRIHWIIWPILFLALLGLGLPLFWPKTTVSATAVPPTGTAVIQADKEANVVPGPSVAAGSIEQPITTIPLSGRLADPSAELSGLAWYGDYLILLPQYPRRETGGGQGYIYALRKSDILGYLDGKSNGPLDPIAIPFNALGLRDKMSNFEGFEAIGFAGDRVYLTIESGAGSKMMGYLVEGKVAPDLSKIEIDTSRLTPIEPQATLNNKADEALLVLDDRILTFYEVNGAAFNPHPVAHVFSLGLDSLGTVPSASLEYRITDAAREPGSNRFWVVDSFFLADLELLPKSDPLAEAFGKGPTHSRWPMVERLVELRYDPAFGVSLAGTAPIQLQLAPMETRNWEGLALLDDRGFLMATDKYPSTLLAFVPFP
jgi:hypothetical protein